MTEIEIKAHVADPVATEKILRGFATLKKETTKSDVYWSRGNVERGADDGSWALDRRAVNAAKSLGASFAVAIAAAVCAMAGCGKTVILGVCLGGFAIVAILSWALGRGRDDGERKSARKKNPRATIRAGMRDDAARPIKVRIRAEGGSVVVTYKRKEIQGEIEVNDEREFAIDDRAAFEALISDMGLTPYISKEKSTKTFAYRASDGTDVSIELSLVAGLGWFAELEILADGPDEGRIAAARRTLRSTLALMGIPDSSIETRYYTDMLREAGEAGESGRSHFPSE
jgi:predicted adenylyl cyclase CyaB